MTQATAMITIDEAGLAILAGGLDVPLEATNYSSRLVGVSSIGAAIPTGTFSGDVHVALELRRLPLDAHQHSPEWEEVSEVTVYTNSGTLEIGPALEDLTASRRDLPAIGDGITHAYRVRVHVRGHQESFEGNAPEEQFLFVVWPAVGDESDAILQSSDPETTVPLLVAGGPDIPSQSVLLAYGVVEDLGRSLIEQHDAAVEAANRRILHERFAANSDESPI